MLKKTISVFFVLTVVLLFVSCSGDNGSSGNPMPNGNTISVRDNLFSPASMTVAIGTTVTWVFQGNNQLTVTSGSPADANAGSLFDNGARSSGSVQFTFNQAGTFNYFCRIHGAAMTGSITVQ
jgi:plastocyanin